MFRAVFLAACAFIAIVAAATTPSPTPTGTPTNCNNFYKVISGDTCQGIVNKYNGLTLSNFLAYNPSINSGCSNLQVGVYYCVGLSTATSTSTSTVSVPTPTASGTTSNCTAYYQVKSGDTCQAIIAKYNITLARFYSWNPSVDVKCDNLQLDVYYCVSVASTTTTTTTSSASKTTSTSSSKTSSTSSKTTSTSSKSASTTSSKTSSSTVPSPTPSGIVANCNKYYLIPSGSSCETVASANSITVAQFESYNTGINAQCTNLLAGYYYCVGVSSATTSSTKTSTTLTTTTKPTTTTTPTKTSTSTSATVSNQPQQSGIVSNCKTFYKVVSGDSCVSVEAKYNITNPQFLSWNTGINSNCTNLWANYYCCVGV